jgi:hypothetical protein
MRRRLESERGFALPVVMPILVVVGLLAAAMLAMTSASLSRSAEDRRATRALAAADAGADVAVWRMNKTLASAELTGLLGLPLHVVGNLGCVNLDARGLLGVSTLSAAGWCPPTPWEDLGSDGAVDASYSYTVSTGINVIGVADLVERKIVATGRAGGEQRRVMVTVRGDLNPDNLLSLFRRYRYVECTARPTGPEPDSGCPE